MSERRIMRGSNMHMTLLFLATGLYSLTVAACDGTVGDLRIIVEGDDRRLSVAPVDMSARVFGEGKACYSEKVVTFAPETHDKHKTQFDLVFDDCSIPDEFTLQVTANTFSSFISDVHVDNTAGDFTGDIELVLMQAELFLDNNARHDSDEALRSMAYYSDGDGNDEYVIIAWPNALIGIESLTIDEIPNDRLTPSLGSVSQSIELKCAAQNVRTASGKLGIDTMLSATTWLRNDGDGSTAHLYVHHNEYEDRPSNDVCGNDVRYEIMRDIEDIHVACCLAGEFPVVVAVLRNDDGQEKVDLYRYSASAEPQDDAPKRPIPDVGQLLDLAILHDDVFVTVRTSNGWELRRYNLNDSAESLSVPLPSEPNEQPMAISVGDKRILVAVRNENTLNIHSYDPETLAALPDLVEVVTDKLPENSEVSLSQCIIVWTEARGDGSASTDLRYRMFRFDEDTRTLALEQPRLVNTVVDGFSSSAPTAHCRTESRALVTFLSASPLQQLDRTSSLYLRQISSAESEEQQ